jgi:hypothetical protein
MTMQMIPSKRVAPTERVAELLFPYLIWDTPDSVNHESGWWFNAAPPGLMTEAMGLFDPEFSTERAHGQPPVTWLIGQAADYQGVLGGLVAPAGRYARIRVDRIIVPGPHAVELAKKIDMEWPVDRKHSALDLAVVEGLRDHDPEHPLWDAAGTSFRDPRDAPWCSFWWD